MRLPLIILAAAWVLAGCAVPVPAPPPERAPEQTPRAVPSDLPDPEVAAQNFVTVVERVEPVAEAVCRDRTRRVNCDFQIVVDSNPQNPPNAFQTVDRRGRPILVITIALIADMRNQEELAFVLGHEAAHHIRGHLSRREDSMVRGAVLAGVLATIEGGGQADIRRAQNIGATLGARAFSKEFELEADELGSLIAFRAGYDPVVGARYFTRIPDPGNVFLGSHPPNAERVALVRRTAARLSR